MTDCIYVAASTHDARYTRICVASIRHFYPDIPIRLLVGGRLQRGLAAELKRYWNVTIADVPPGEYGWGFVKLEVLFGKARERFLVLDSDTAIVGDVLALRATSDAAFMVDNEEQSESQIAALYFDWKKAAEAGIDAEAPSFVFNTGQWFGTAGLLDRRDFATLVDWSRFPSRVKYPHIFKQGEQGVFNYVLNRCVTAGRLTLALDRILLWPGRGMEGINAAGIAARETPPLVVHWAGLKRLFMRKMIGYDVLAYYETLYFSRLPFGRVRRSVAICGYISRELRRQAAVRVMLRMQTVFG